MKYFNQMFVCMEIFHIFAAKSLIIRHENGGLNYGKKEKCI